MFGLNLYDSAGNLWDQQIPVQPVIAEVYPTSPQVRVFNRPDAVLGYFILYESGDSKNSYTAEGELTNSGSTLTITTRKIEQLTELTCRVIIYIERYK